MFLLCAIPFSQEAMPLWVMVPLDFSTQHPQAQPQMPANSRPDALPKPQGKDMLVIYSVLLCN